MHDPSSSRSKMPRPSTTQTAAAEPVRQLQEMLNLLREQQAKVSECNAAKAERADMLRSELADARAEAKARREERKQRLEAKLSQTKEALELERQRRSENDLRIERERADAIERDEVIQAQLGDLTDAVQEQRDLCTSGKELQ